MQPAEFAEYCQRLRSGYRRRGHRGLLLLSGDRDWAESLLTAVFSAGDQRLLVGRQSLLDLQPNRKSASLGIESDWVVIDGHHYSSVNDWLAAAGTLRAGGLLVLLCPRLEEWPQRYAQAMAAQGFTLPLSRFIARLCALLPEQPGTTIVEQGAETVPHLDGGHGVWQADMPSVDQQRCIAAICRVAQGRAGRPLIIRADRGRGKTSALGVAAAQLLRDGARRLILSAARREMVEIAFRHAAEALPGAARDRDQLRYGDSVLEYLPPAQLLDRAREGALDGELVMVDEAANLPLPILQALLRDCSRLVLSSTVHGYEGSGRGFDIRLRDSLNQLRPRWRRQTLKTPLRWAESDPLEACLNRCFLLDVESEVAAETSARPVTLESLSAPALMADESLLRQVFALLMEAHYQTTPQDLQYLLDMPGRLRVARRAGRVVGVCQALPEGGVEEGLAEQVCRGQRRPKGNLLAQSLAQRSGDRRWLVAASLRVNRIAVAADQRRLGVASALLEQLVDEARRQGLAFVSSSFSCEAALLEFWSAQGLMPVHLGSRRDASSGSYSLMVVLPLRDDWLAPLARLRTSLRDELWGCAALLRSDMPAGALAALLARLPSAAAPGDSTQARRYSQGELPFEQVAMHLKRLCFAAPGLPELVVEKLFLDSCWRRLAARHSLAGRAACERRLREYYAGYCGPDMD